MREKLLALRKTLFLYTLYQPSAPPAFKKNCLAFQAINPTSEKLIITSACPPDQFSKQIHCISKGVYPKFFPARFARRDADGLRATLQHFLRIQAKQLLFIISHQLGWLLKRIVWVFWQSTILIYHQVPPAFKKRKFHFETPCISRKMTWNIESFSGHIVVDQCKN